MRHHHLVVDLVDLALAVAKRKKQGTAVVAEPDHRGAVAQTILDILVALLERVVKIVEIIGHSLSLPFNHRGLGGERGLDNGAEGIFLHIRNAVGGNGLGKRQVLCRPSRRRV